MQWAYAGILLLLVSGCAATGIDDSSRRVRTTPIQKVNELAFSGPANLHFVHEADSFVRVEGSSVAIEQVVVKQEGRRLVIRSAVSGVDVYVSAEGIENVRFGMPKNRNVSNDHCNISVSGDARAQLDSIVAESVDINIDGEGKVQIGTINAGKLATRLDAYGSIKATSLSYLSK